MIGSAFAQPNQPLRNLCPYPTPDAGAGGAWRSEWGNGGAGSASFLTGAPNGGQYRRMTWTSAVTDTSLAIVNGVDFPTSSFRPNTRYTAVLWARASFAASGALIAFWRPDNVPWGAAFTTKTPGVWQKYIFTGTAPSLPSGHANEIYMQARLVAATPRVGDTLDTAMFMAVEGDYPSGIYVDGNIPGWQWTGAANASESVGYPYTLESVAGTPLASISTPGGSAPLTLGAFEGRTLYLVHDVVDTSANLMSLASIGSSISAGGGTMVIRTGSTSSVYLENRPQTNNGTPIFVDAAGARTVGRHVSSATASNGATSASICVDGGTITTLALTPGTGFTANPLLNLAVATPSDIPVYAVAYQGEHDAITRSRVTAWLGRQYGCPIPTGY